MRSSRREYLHNPSLSFQVFRGGRGRSGCIVIYCQTAIVIRQHFWLKTNGYIPILFTSTQMGIMAFILKRAKIFVAAHHYFFPWLFSFKFSPPLRPDSFKFNQHKLGVGSPAEKCTPAGRHEVQDGHILFTNESLQETGTAWKIDGTGPGRVGTRVAKLCANAAHSTSLNAPFAQTCWSLAPPCSSKWMCLREGKGRASH